MLYKTVGGGTYWFTSALVVVQLIFLILLLTRVRNVWFYAVMGISIGIIATYLVTNDMWSSGRNYWAYKQGLISMIFFALGGLYWRYEKFLSWYVMAPLLVVYFFVVGFSYDLIGCVVSTFYINALGILMSALICLMLPRMFRDLESVDAITYIGKHSICFYFMSGALPIVIGLLIKRFFGVSILGYSIDFVICISLVYIGTYVINRWFPWMLDLRVLQKKK